MGSWEDLQTREMEAGQLSKLVEKAARGKTSAEPITPIEVDEPVAFAEGSGSLAPQSTPPVATVETQRVVHTISYPARPSSPYRWLAMLIVLAMCGAIAAAAYLI